MTAVRYIAGAGAIGGLFAACALAIKNWRKDKPVTATCNTCGITQVLKDGISADEFRQYHHDKHDRQREAAQQRARRQNAGRN